MEDGGCLFNVICAHATLFLVPARIPVPFLTRSAAVPGGLTLPANLEVLQMAHNLAPGAYTRSLLSST